MHLLSRCLQGRTFATRIDEDDDIEPLIRARLPLQITPVTTNGDGACAIHFVWGAPDNLNQVTWPDARRLAAQALGESPLYLRTHIPVEFVGEVGKVATGLWNELVVGNLEGRRTAEVQSSKNICLLISFAKPRSVSTEALLIIRVWMAVKHF